jgi:glycosyltransferase involved in cell wall biosynthesis
VPTPATSDISVVIPYYNREEYIDEAIQSVLAQTLQPLEIIIVNDCSRESSRRYLDHYAGVCTVIDLPLNVGLAAARNEGIRCARGQFIAFLDDDDVWESKKLEVQVQYLRERPDCAAVHTALRAFYAGGAERIFDQKPSPLTLSHALKQPSEVLVSSLLIRADVVQSLGGFDPRFRRGEDHEFQIRCAAASYRMEAIPELLVRFRRQGHASLTKRNLLMFLAHVRLCRKHKALFRRVYGVRGVVSFLLASLELDSGTVRYVGGAIRFLTRLIPVKWEVRPDYEEPVQGVPKLNDPSIQFDAPK